MLDLLAESPSSIMETCHRILMLNRDYLTVLSTPEMGQVTQTKQIMSNTQLHSIMAQKLFHFKDRETVVSFGFICESLFMSENILKIFVPMAFPSWNSTPDKQS